MGSIRIDRDWIRQNFFRELGIPAETRIHQDKDSFIVDLDNNGVGRGDIRVFKKLSPSGAVAFSFIGRPRPTPTSLKRDAGFGERLIDHWTEVENNTGPVGSRAIYFAEGATAPATIPLSLWGCFSNKSDSRVAAGTVGKCIPIEPFPGYQTCLMDLPQVREMRSSALRQSLDDPLPMSVDHRPTIDQFCPPVHSQGLCGWCVAHAVNAGIEAILCNGVKGDGVSEPHLWYLGRPDKDINNCRGGWYIGSAMAAAQEHAIVPHEVWPYPANAHQLPPDQVVSKIQETKPTDAVLEGRARYQVNESGSVPSKNVAALKAALAQGHNVAYGVPVFEGTGWCLPGEQCDKKTISLPTCEPTDTISGTCLNGYHAILITGYDDNKREFQFRNSWSGGWLDKGYGRLSYDVIEKYGDGGHYPISLVGQAGDGGQLQDMKISPDMEMPSLFAQPVKYASGGIEPMSVAVGDFNNDRNQDISIVNAQTHNVSIFLGKGDGTFQGAVNYLSGKSPNFIATEDFNNDGNADLAVANCLSSEQYDCMHVLLGRGDGSFQVPVRYPTQTDMRFIAAAYLNGDNNADLIVLSGYHVAAPSIFFGNGDGTFKPLQEVSMLGTGVSTLAVKDFNRDGREDIALSKGNVLQVHLGNGDGTFSTPRQYFKPPGPIVAGDFNNDHLMDIAAVGYSLGVLLGNGDGTFQAAITSQINQPAWRHIVAADFNNDGNVDLAFPNDETSMMGNATVLLGKGDGTFPKAVELVVGVWVQAIATGDFNKDGRMDLVATDGWRNNDISIFLNISP